MAKPARVSRRRRGQRVALLTVAAAIPMCSLLAGSAHAAPATVTVGDIAEAWYASAPIDVCSTPLGCPPQAAPTSPYPSGSLHVGVASGQETARSYVQPDLSRLPFGSTLLSGTMTLHVDTANTDGSLSPGTAQILACLVTAPFNDGTQGSPTKPPAIDCTTSAKPSYDAKTAVFTLDLATFLDAWNAGKQQLGIALVPNQSEVSQTDAWHVTIEGRKQTGAKPVTSTITYRAPPADVGIGTSLSPIITVPPPPSYTAPQAPLPGPAPAGPAPAPVVAPQPPPVATVAQRPVAFAGPIQNPAAFLAPLALLAGVVFFARLFTRDATPRRSSS
jgi:hypothetical protein